jgi:hypothetical protein
MTKKDRNKCWCKAYRNVSKRRVIPVARFRAWLEANTKEVR